MSEFKGTKGKFNTKKSRTLKKIIMESLKQIIEKLEQTRKEKDLSYEQVAKMINSSRSTIWKILTHLAVPNADTFLRLMDALGYNYHLTSKNMFKEISRGDVPSFTENTIETTNLKQGNSIGEFKRVYKEKTKPKEKTLPKTKKVKPEPKKEVSECPNCKYSQTQSGLRIKILKCNDCKTKKK